MLIVILASFVVMLASLVGVISIWSKLGQIIQKNLHFLVSFSAGVFLLIAYELGHETIEHAENGYGWLWILVGALGLWLIFKFLPSFHHHHDNDSSSEAHTHSGIDARKIMISDGIHNIGDGILLAASFAVSASLGWMATLSVFIHEIIQEISEFFVLKEAGYSTRKALKLNFLVSGTILIGSIGAYFLLDNFEAFEAPLLGISAGTFLIVVLQDLIPHSIKNSSKKHILKHLVWFALGLVVMYFVSHLTTHSH
jgi:zinc and cadmium transporter